MSVSQHPVALRLEQQVGGATRLLATVMALPLVDGIFPALVIAGALSTPVDIIQTGLLIFGGSATVAVILAEMEGTRREQMTSVLILGVVLLPIAGLEAAFAPTIKTLLDFHTFHRFAGLVILAVAAKTASSEVGEKLPSPSIIIALGLVASFNPANAQLKTNPDPTIILHAVAAAGTGVGFALVVAMLGPRLRGVVDINLFRFGSSVALGMLAIDVLGVLPTDRPIALGVLGVTALFAYDPAADDPAEDAELDADTNGIESEDSHESDDPDTYEQESDDASAPAAVADGGNRDGSASVSDDGNQSQRQNQNQNQPDDESGDAGYGYPAEKDSRAPWL
ncbi:hypothetical protein ELS19_05750 [Halogeometricum borinquense]|uniref:Uncharacterized protein n=1 Tax=Halogeometricum borinquense TaxID=60847 RepID=A0A482T9W1_9EURY|nr:DUF5794 domain-containing protein [Halogeometricum borinquense]RYJ13512.1 hypothetical protein ELS19_05750 [Halogeometricum borinquense]